jgi:hypothetical protein
LYLDFPIHTISYPVSPAADQWMSQRNGKNRQGVTTIGSDRNGAASAAWASSRVTRRWPTWRWWRLELRDELPRDPLGKVLKRELRAELAGS